MDSYFFLLLHPCTAVFGKSISFFKTQILVISLWYCKPTPAMARISSFLSKYFSSFSNFFSVLVTPYNLKQIAAFGFPSAVLAGGGAAGTVFFLSSAFLGSFWVTFGGSFLSSTFFLAALAFFVASSAFFLMSFSFSAFFPSDVIFFASAIFFLASLTESPISLLPSASSTSLLLFLPKPFAWA